MADQIHWLTLVVGVCFGGAAGALFTHFATEYRSRRPAVGKKLEVTPLFSGGFAGAVLKPTVTVTDGDCVHSYERLYVADLTVVNLSNKDMDAFTFGATLTEADTCIHAEPYTPDRHHTLTTQNKVCPSTPSRLLDFDLKPFNRRDIYKVRLYITTAAGEPGNIEVSSSTAAVFTEIPSISATIKEVSASVAKGYLNTFLGFRLQ